MKNDNDATAHAPQSSVSLADLLLASLAIVAFALALLELSGVLSSSAEMPRLLVFIDAAICGFFFLDFLRSLFKAENKWHYLRTWGWFDLVSSIPVIAIPGAALGYAPVAMRLARLARVLRAIRSVRMLILLARRDRSGAVLTGILLFSIVISVGSCIGVLWAETRPDLPPAIAAKVSLDTADEVLWWAVVTCSTVGYGDATPVTTAGRIFAFGLMVVGIGAFATVTSTLGLLIGKLRDPKPQGQDEIQVRLDRMEQRLQEVLDRVTQDSDPSDP